MLDLLYKMVTSWAISNRTQIPSIGNWALIGLNAIVVE